MKSKNPNKKNEIIKKAKKLGITEVHFGETKDPTCPQDLKFDIEIGECPFSWCFYGATREKSMDDALAWFEKIKNKKCICSW